MKDLFNVLSKEEIISLSLRSLYSEYGYEQYKMSKFEEYELYVRNKDFLVSENVIAFTDTDGKLLALKPDVTLSIIKNSKDAPEKLTKVYYNENVYRVSKGTRSFKEIMQAGLECFGNVTDEALCEVILLAEKSLSVISKNNVLEVSHLDIVLGVLENFNLTQNAKNDIFNYLGEKNVEGVEDVCKSEGLSFNDTEIVKKLVTIYGKPNKVIFELEVFRLNDKTSKAIDQLKAVVGYLEKNGVGDNVFIDFSVLNDMKYYNGLAFKGFIEGIPTGVLSGGQYDGLMNKMDKKSRAIGFAVYLDELSKLSGLGGALNE